MKTPCAEGYNFRTSKVVLSKETGNEDDLRSVWENALRGSTEDEAKKW